MVTMIEAVREPVDVRVVLERAVADIGEWISLLPAVSADDPSASGWRLAFLQARAELAAACEIRPVSIVGT